MSQHPRRATGAERPRWIKPVPAAGVGPPLHDDPLLHAILAGRAMDAAAAADFLDARRRPAPDPLALPGMGSAVERIARALRRDEPIGIFGDYDTDGVTSSALLTHALRAASTGAQPVAIRLPQRHEGYGLSEAGVDDLADAGVRLLIAVDCGSKDHAAVARARTRGLDVVIVDHHQVSGDLPDGAIVATAQAQHDAPYQSVSAAGLAYLLAVALAQAGFDSGGGVGKEPLALLDLAMIGLIGDVSPLLGVNRALVRDGLRELRERPRLGLRAMADGAGIGLAKLSSTDAAYLVSPRLNAPGRLGDPLPAYDLLMSATTQEAFRLASLVEVANQRRKSLQDRVLRDVEAILAADPRRLERRLLVVAGHGWEPGVVGLAAGKLAERYRRPAVVLSLQDGEARGSARSVAGFDITRSLDESASLLIRHGGHAMAAGLSVAAGKLPELEEALLAAIASSDAPEPGPPRLEIEAELPPERLNLATVGLVNQLGPFGQGNAVPLLRASGLPLRGYVVMGRERQHLKLQTHGPDGLVDAILWSGAERSRELVGVRAVDVVGYLESNEWNGTRRVQLRVADFRAAGR